MEYPRFIALCGHPKAGKTSVMNILQKNYGYEPVDDGLPLRKVGMEHFGLTHDQVFTQPGKLELVTINGQEMEVRDVLGRIGNGFEQQFGPDIIPEMSARALDPLKRYCFGCVRREQGAYYKRLGGVVVEIVNPMAGPSKFEFDRFNRAHVDFMLFNVQRQFETLEDGSAQLSYEVAFLMKQIELRLAA